MCDTAEGKQAFGQRLYWNTAALIDRLVGGFTSMKALIVGAGFGGLALAASLQREGHAVTIVEKQKDHTPTGFVIGLWSNGMHTLEPFGAVERIQRLSIPVTEELIRNKTGKIIVRMDYRPLIEHAGKVFLLLHSDLQEILRELAAKVPIRFETTVSTLEEQQQSVAVTFNDGTQEDFDLVVGADGIHSQVRKLLFGDEGFEYSGLRIWLAMLPAGKESPKEPNDLFGEAEYIGVFPTLYEKVGGLFLATVPPGEPNLPQQRIPYLQERFHDFGWLIPEMLQSLHDPGEIFSADIDQVSLGAWYRGRVVLLGDAAHAVSPTAALGGAMALEDAHVLAEELRQVDATQVEQALAKYVARRKSRVAEVRHTADFLIWLASMDNPALTFVRNTIMHLIPSSYLLKGMEPILETPA